MALTNQKIKTYRSIGHKLKPVVMISDQGISEGVQLEIERALNDHELIKIKISCADRVYKKALIEQVCDISHCELIQTIGNIALIYRAASKPSPKLSNLLRLQ
ncbi:MAG: YhbY family RNA-binding protein [Pseudomonadales bacterium]|nr:YhbY family RNA-binding protein [Pseudomonadales bacterium]